MQIGRNRIFVAALLAVGFCFAYTDRQVVNVLLPSFKHSLGLTLVQASLIQGLAFSLFFALAGVPLGIVADRYNRRNLLVFGIACWSLATMACGLANSFWPLFFARLAVGVGEACLAPISASLLADYYPAHQRGRAINMVQTGSAFGSLVAMLGGGWLLTWLDRSDVVARIGAPFQNWQVVFIVVGAPGLALAALMAVLQEPPRREGTSPRTAQGAGVWVLFTRRPAAFLCILTLQAFLAMLTYAILSWTPTMLMSSYGQSAGGAGTIMAGMLAASGVGAYVLSGMFSDALIRWRPKYGRVLLPGLTLPLGAAALVWLYLDHTLVGAVLATGSALFAGVLAAATGIPSLQAIVPNRLRGQAIAVLFLIITLLGLGAAPTLVAAVADAMGGARHGIQPALAIVCLATVLGSLAVWPFLLASYARAENYELEEFAQAAVASDERRQEGALA